MNEFFLNHSDKRPSFSRTFSRPSRPRLSISLRLIGFLLSLPLVASSAFFLLRVRTIHCTFEGNPCEAQDQQMAQQLSGGWMFVEKPQRISGKKAVIQRRFPGIIVVKLEQLETIALVRTSLSGDEGMRIREDGSIEPVSLSSEQTASSSALLYDLSLAANLQESRIPTERLTVYDALSDFAKKESVDKMVIRSRDEIEIDMTRDLTVLVSSIGLADQLRSLQSILSSPTIESKPARVDMRFARPILQYL